MRHNHNIKEGGQQTHLTKLFHNYCQVEKFNRFFVRKHESIFKTFVKKCSIGKEKKICDISELKLYASSLDDMLGLKGAMREHLTNSKTLNRNKNEIKFTDIVEDIAKFASLNHMEEAHFEKVFSKIG